MVLPAPPTVALPQQITGTGARQPGRAARRAVTRAHSAAAVQAARGSTPSRCQNAGARIRRRRQQRRERRRHRVGRSASRRMATARCRLAPSPARARLVAQHRIRTAARQRRRIGDAARPAGLAQAPPPAREVVRICGPTTTAQPSRAGSSGFCPPCGTRLPPTNTIRAQAVEQSQLAQRVGDPDARRLRRRPAPAARRGTLRVLPGPRSPPRAAGWRGHDDGQQAGMRRRDQRRCTSAIDRLLAGMRAGGEPGRAPGQRAAQPRQVRRIDRQRRRRRISDRPAQSRAAAPKRPQPLPHPPPLAPAPRRNRRAAARASPARRAASARSCARGHAGIDQHQRDAARAAGGEQVRPELALHEAGGVRPPVIEEARHPGAARPAARTGAAPGRASSACAAASSPAAVTVPVVSSTSSGGAAASCRQHRQDRDGLADARGMQPEQPARPGAAARRSPRRSPAAPRPPCRAAPARQQQQQRRPGEASRRRRPVEPGAQARQSGRPGRPPRSAPPRWRAAPPPASRGDGDRAAAHHDAAAERQRQHHAVPARQHAPARGLGRAGQHRHAGETRRAAPPPGRPPAAAGRAARPGVMTTCRRRPAAAPASAAPPRHPCPRRHGAVEPCTAISTPKRRTTSPMKPAVAVAADQDMHPHPSTPLGAARLPPEHRHHRQPFVPEGGDGGRTGEVRRQVLGAMQRPARGAQRKCQVATEQCGQQRLRHRPPQQGFQHGGAGSMTAGDGQCERQPASG